jgi:hypothetical protein
MVYGGCLLLTTTRLVTHKENYLFEQQCCNSVRREGHRTLPFDKDRCLDRPLEAYDTFRVAPASSFHERVSSRSRD